MLTGPNLAREILEGNAAAAVVATPDPVVAEYLQRIFHMNLFRVYTNPDVVGCEIAGALKNVIAIAAAWPTAWAPATTPRPWSSPGGCRSCPGSAWRWAVSTRRSPAWPAWATCWPPASRRTAGNRHVGEQLGRGRTIDEVIDEMNMVAEGVKTSRVVMDLAEQFGVEMPIATEVHAVCHEGSTAEDAYRGLIRRQDGGVEHPSLSY